MENIFQNSGNFSAAPQQRLINHVLPRNPPQLHHKNTTAAHRIFQNHPQKHPQTRGFPTRHHAQIFF
jgi:hypothetical protein